MAIHSEKLPNISKRINPFSILDTRAVTDKTMYGYSIDNAEGIESGFIKFSSADPANIQVIGNSSDLAFRSAAEANGKYYAIAITTNFPQGLYSVDLTTGKATLIADYEEDPKVRAAIDMSYDYSTETMYFITNSDKSGGDTPFGLNTALWKVNLQNGTQEKIHEDLGVSLLTLAINYDGQMYGIAREGKLYHIDPFTGTTTLIGDTGINAWFWQSMEFDKGTGVLYWASFSTQDESVLCSVNTEDASITSLGALGNAEKIIGLHIPFELCDNPQAPAQVSNLLIKADPAGVKKATISWSNPSKTYGGNALTNITKIEIIRNGELVHTVDNTQPGKEESWMDNVSDNATYVYKLIPYNAAGTGAAKQISTFIGHDLPAAVMNAAATTVDAKTIKLTWNAASQGIHKGYVDLSSIRYKITRNDGVTVANNLTATSFEDQTISKLARYTYTIEVSNADGTGGTTITNYVITGPSLGIPYSTDFSDTEAADLWDIKDMNNDDNTFSIDEYNPFATAYAYWGSGMGSADDWLLSPTIQINKDKNYKCVVEACSSSDAFPQQFSICLIKNNDLENAIVLETFDVANITPVEYRVNFSGITNGDYRIGIHCTSDDSNESFAAYSVLLDENNDGNIRGDVYDDKDKPVSDLVVSLEETDFKAITNADGVFEIKNVPEGDYTIRCTKLGYKDTPQLVSVKRMASSNVELDVVVRKIYNIDGMVTNEYDEKVENATITVGGYNAYSTQSDKNGTFKIEGVYEHEEPYTICASKQFYEKNEKSEIIDKNSTFNFTIKDKILPPAVAIVQSGDGQKQPTISWTQPGEEMSVKKHSDETLSSIEMDEGDKNIIGILCKEPMVLKAINWNLSSNQEEINVVIIALNKDGNPTSDILYIDTHAPSVPWETTNYQLSKPVAAPYGCFIGVGCNQGAISILTTENTPEFPFIESFNGYMNDYTKGKITFVESNGEDYRENFSINIEGLYLTGTEAPSVKYNVYRDETNLLTPSAITELSIEDADWNTLPEKTYVYEVEAVYRNDQHARTRTNEIAKTPSGGIQTSNVSGIYASLSSDGTRILFSEPVDEAEVFAIEGTVITKESFVEGINIRQTAKGIYIVKMKKDGKSYNQKLVIK